MAITLDVTVAGTSSNTYCDLAAAESYHEVHLHKTDWDNADDEEKKASLVWATRILDETIDWDGAKASVEQKLRWPRYGLVDRDGIFIDSDVIPEFLQFATAELARSLITSDRSVDPETKGINSMSVGGLSFSFDKVDRPGVLPDSVIRMVSPYGEVKEQGTGFRMLKVVR